MVALGKSAITRLAYECFHPSEGHTDVQRVLGLWVITFKPTFSKFKGIGGRYVFQGTFKPSLRQDRSDASATLSEKAADVFVRSGEENDDVQYYLVQGEDDDEDDDDEDDEDEENDVDVDNDDNINIDNGDEDDEVMREYRDILTEVQQLERGLFILLTC